MKRWQSNSQCALSPLIQTIFTRESLSLWFYSVLGTLAKSDGAGAASLPTKLIYMWLGLLARLFATEGNTDIIGVFKIVQI